MKSIWHVSVTPLLQQHPMVLVLVLTDVLVVPCPLPLCFVTRSTYTTLSWLSATVSSLT